MAELAPEVTELIDRIEAMMAAVASAGPAGGGTMDQMRAAAQDAIESIFASAGGVRRAADGEAVHAIPVESGEITARCYTPAGDGPLPAYLHFHGGAWIMGSASWPTFEAYAREVAERVGCVVLDADYRLAPEHRFPTGLEDCYASLEWLFAHADELGIDPRRVAIGGDSAGANLAAAVCLMARDRGSHGLVAQLLEVPAPDHRFEARYESWREFGAGFGLESQGLVDGKAFYFEDPQDALSPLASPLLAKDLSGLPPAFVMTAECDPLRDMGEAYGERLAEAGVPTVVSRQLGHIHGSSFLLHPSWEGARRWRDEVVAILSSVLTPAAEPVAAGE
jgi:acetyl esterase